MYIYRSQLPVSIPSLEGSFSSIFIVVIFKTTDVVDVVNGKFILRLQYIFTVDDTSALLILVELFVDHTCSHFHFQVKFGRGGRARMLVGFPTTYAISAYHH